MGCLLPRLSHHGAEQLQHSCLHGGQPQRNKLHCIAALGQLAGVESQGGIEMQWHFQVGFLSPLETHLVLKPNAREAMSRIPFVGTVTGIGYGPDGASNCEAGDT